MGWVIKAFWNKFNMKKNGFSCQLSLEEWRQDGLEEIGNPQCCKSYKTKPHNGMKPQAHRKVTFTEYFSECNFLLLFFVWGRAWLVTKGEEMHWKTKPWKQHDNYFLFLKNIFLKFVLKNTWNIEIALI